MPDTLIVAVETLPAWAAVLIAALVLGLPMAAGVAVCELQRRGIIE